MALPVSFQVKAQFLEDRPQKEMEKRAGVYNFAYLDLLPLLRQHSSEKLFFDHCHLTARGNEIVGRALADFLLEKRTPQS